MTDLKTHLIRLGDQHPELRHHLRPIINATEESLQQVKKRMLERARREYIWVNPGSLSRGDISTPIEVDALRALKHEGKVDFHIGKGYRAVDAYFS